jgi:hypothetical protein
LGSIEGDIDAKVDAIQTDMRGILGIMPQTGASAG